jgi:hypothetical protein
MIATEFKLIPLEKLCAHEPAVLRQFNTLPVRYLLPDDPVLRRPLLFFVLLTHLPDLLNGEFAADELFYNRYYWFSRFSKKYQQEHGYDAGFEQEAHQLLEYADIELDERLVEVEKHLDRELRTNEWEIAVAFSDFSISKVKGELGIHLDEAGDYFSAVEPVAIASGLVDTLKTSLPLALKINTEKARSEMIVAPLLIEVYRQLDGTISLFSGVDWEVDRLLGLCGRCDFLISRSPEQLRIESPVLAVVEVKNDDIAAGIAQCLAEMVAARIFNQRNGSDIPTIYGAVTTGSAWRFLRLIESTAYLDETEYYINDAARIVGIIVSMFTSSGIATKL